MFGKVASTVRPVRAVEDFIVENGEAECEAKTDGVCRWEFSYGDVGGGLVSILSARSFRLRTQRVSGGSRLS